MKKILPFIACTLLLTSCGSSGVQPAETTVATTPSTTIAEEEPEPVYEDITVYDFIIPAAAKCTLSGRLSNSVSVQINCGEDEITAQFFQSETKGGYWSDSDMYDQAKSSIMIMCDMEMDYDKIINAECNMETSSANGWKIYTIRDYKGKSGIYACRQYNVSNYGIIFRADSLLLGGKPITDYNDNIVSFLNEIKIT